MSSSHLDPQKKKEQLEKVRQKREASLREDLKKQVRDYLMKGVLSSTAAHLDAALSIDRNQVMVEVLRELANEIESVMPKKK